MSQISGDREAALDAEARAAVTDFQREIYKVRDGRIAAADNASGVLSAAAGTVATVAAALLRDTPDQTPTVVILSLAAGSILLNALGRREQPIMAGDVRSTGIAARDAVVEVHAHAKDDSISKRDMLTLCFDAWYQCHESANARERQKRAIYAAALAFFLVEVLVVVLTVIR